MPKRAKYTLIWSPSREGYELYGQDERGQPRLCGDDETWFAWLAAHSAFSFQGQHGQLNLLKEARPRGGDGYWYAYRRQGRRMAKKYIGRSADLTMARLEAVASALASAARLASDTSSPPNDALVRQLRATGLGGAEGDKLERPVSGEFIIPASPHQAPLLEPKLRPPRPQTSLVVRERLLAQLDAGLSHKLTLIAAPAGFGKTTLLSQWVADRRARGDLPPLAWVSLDEGDNDLIRFWRYVFTACRAIEPDLEQAAVALLATPQAPFVRAPLEPVLTAFLNALSDLPRGGVLVLEDYHAITEPRIHETVAFVLDHLPATLHVVLLTRSSPPLSLARWRARNELHEVSAADLRFSPAEMATFLQHHLAFPLTAEAMRQLDAHLEGWPAGLRLVTLALQGHVPEQQIEPLLATFAGSHRHLLEYLVTEVLDAQPKALQIFLLQTSVLSRLTGSLCDVVTGRNDSERLLDTMERAGLFLLPLGETEPWYRYHLFFAEAMQQAARRRLGAEALGACSSRASAWYEQHGMLADAVDAALAAGEGMRAAVLMERFIERQPLAEYYELYTLQRWLAQLPEVVLHGAPALCFLYANVLVFSSVSDQLAPVTSARVETLLRLAEQGWRSSDSIPRLGEVLAFRALLAVRQRDIAQAARLARQALVQLPDADRVASSRVICLGIVGEDARQAGQFDTAREQFLAAYALCEATGNPPGRRVVQLALGEVCRGQGELHQAAEHYHQVLAEAGEDPTDRAKALLGLAQLAYTWNDLEAADRHAQAALDLGQQLADRAIEAQASLLLARVQHAYGQTTPALQRLAMLLAHVPPARWPLLHREVLVCQARLQLAAGDRAAVQHWVTDRAQDDVVLPLLQREQEELLVARWHLAQGEADAAWRLLNQWLSDAQAGGRTYSVLEIQLLMALAQHMRQQTHAAHQLLQAVLTRAAVEGELRLLLDEGETLAALLAQSVALGPEGTPAQEPRKAQNNPLHAYVEQLRTAFETQTGALDMRPAGQSVLGAAIERSNALVEPLSPQEQRVLRLLAAGLSNPEIAQELVVSVNTVKTHLQRIYQKLHVTNRREAREAARRLQLR